jgi:hypothetical protein
MRRRYDSDVEIEDDDEVIPFFRPDLVEEITLESPPPSMKKRRSIVATVPTVPTIPTIPTVTTVTTKKGSSTRKEKQEDEDEVIILGERRRGADYGADDVANNVSSQEPKPRVLPESVFGPLAIMKTKPTEHDPKEYKREKQEKRLAKKFKKEEEAKKEAKKEEARKLERAMAREAEWRDQHVRSTIEMKELKKRMEHREQKLEKQQEELAEERRNFKEEQDRILDMGAKKAAVFHFLKRAALDAYEQAVDERALNTAEAARNYYIEFLMRPEEYIEDYAQELAESSDIITQGLYSKPIAKILSQGVSK